MPRRLGAVLALVAACAALTACGGGSSSSAAPATTAADAVSDSSPETPASTTEDPGDQAAADDGTAGQDATAGEDPGDQAAAADDAAADGSQGDSAENGTASQASRPSQAAAAGEVVLDEPDADETAAEPEPEPEAPTGPTAPLTGLITTDTSLDQRRAVAVKIDNGDKRGRPQAGLAAADVVYEELIEGAKTRLLAVYHSEMPSRVGPVRSVRSGDLGLLTDLSAPYLVSSGANVTVLEEMRQADRAGTMIDIGGLRTFVPYSRDPARLSPFNLYFHYANVVGDDGSFLRGGPLDQPVTPLFDYGSSNPDGITGAAGVTVTYHRNTGNVISHVWDDELGGWVRIQQGTPMVTETDFGLVEVAPANVVVMSVPYDTSAADSESPQVTVHGAGDALVLTAGVVHEAVWERTPDRVGYRFTNTAGHPLSLSPGSTWLLLANTTRRFPVAETEVLTWWGGAQLLSEARALAEAEAEAERAAEGNAAEAS